VIAINWSRKSRITHLILNNASVVIRYDEDILRKTEFMICTHCQKTKSQIQLMTTSRVKSILEVNANIGES